MEVIDVNAVKVDISRLHTGAKSQVAKADAAGAALSPLESRVRLYLEAAGVEHEPVATHTVQRLISEARRLYGEPADTATVMKLVIDHHHGMMVTDHPAPPAAARRQMTARPMRCMFQVIGRLLRWKALRLKAFCEQTPPRYAQGSTPSEAT